MIDRLGWLSIFLTLCFVSCGSAQKRFDQDPTLNNLEHPNGYVSCQLGDLGHVKKIGTGATDVILIAGAGFGGDVFDSFMRTNAEQFTMYAVTLPGYAGTAAPPMPAKGVSYGAMTWTKAAQRGIEELIAKEKLDRPVVIGHWMVAANIALELAKEAPDKISTAILIAGRAKNVPVGHASGPQFESPELRAKWVDFGMAPQWFKTVTRDTWDDNNFYPHDYSKNPIRGLQLWRQAANATLPTHVRYLCESLTQDSTLGLAKLKVPVLVIQPDFDEQMYVENQKDYMRAFCHASWDGVEEKSKLISVVRIPETRAFIMDDQPERLNAVIRDFLNKSR